MIDSPFAPFLEPEADMIPAAIRQHFLPAREIQRFRGTMKHVWRRKDWLGNVSIPVLWIGAFAGLLFPEIGDDVSFELENQIFQKPDGQVVMTWSRKFHFPKCVREFHAVMHFDRERNAIVDFLGKGKQLEVELHPRIENGGVTITSGKQWLRVGILRIPLPSWIAGQAKIYESLNDNGQFVIRVTIHNPILQDFFGYEGTFESVSEQP